MQLGLTGKTALVTGANRGTGQVIAETLASEGAHVLVHSVEQGAADEVAENLPNATAVAGDIRNASGCAEVLEQVSELVGCPDILVNNFGSASGGKWSKLSDDDWLGVYQVNALSATRLIEGLLPTMRTKGWGRIIQLGTIGSSQPNARMPHYYAAKAALANITVSLALELENTGITVNTVSPGLIHTPELEAGYRLLAEKRGWPSDWDSIVERIVAKDFPNPVGRLATRQEVADAVVFLASERAAFINGQNLKVDGGASRSV